MTDTTALLLANGLVVVPLKPTEAMLDAGENETWEPSSDRPYIGHYTLERVWRAMIDAAPK